MRSKDFTLLCLALVSVACLPLPLPIPSSNRDRVVKYAASPGGKYKAMVIERPGATTIRPSWHLEVLRSYEQIGQRVSAVSVQTPYPGCEPPLTDHDCANITRIDIQWISNDSLVVSIDSHAQLLAGRRDFGGGTRLSGGVPDDVRLVVKTRYIQNWRP